MIILTTRGGGVLAGLTVAAMGSLEGRSEHIVGQVAKYA